MRQTQCGYGGIPYMSKENTGRTICGRFSADLLLSYGMDTILDRVEPPDVQKYQEIKTHLEVCDLCRQYINTFAGILAEGLTNVADAAKQNPHFPKGERLQQEVQDAEHLLQQAREDERKRRRG